MNLPTDPTVMAYLANLYAEKVNNQTNATNDNYYFQQEQDDEYLQNQAVHFFSECHRLYPVDLEVISWLGVWYVRNELYEKAIKLFISAAEIQPTEVKWELMVTSCYRRMSRYHKALEMYEDIHRKYPANVECLKYIVTISKDLGLPFDEYQQKLLQTQSEQGPKTKQTIQTTTGGKSLGYTNTSKPEPEAKEEPIVNIDDDDIADLFD